ncbi:hypothetical protein IVB12_05425 [Bradyrhizobium sp. 179]|uniref:hypothetical protein n=1 Tax=Bradyrhizobium sp. 179 TaxID=2782648 RepID=UPI001FF93BE2|nr:hypothetical protein [Bradyrhizobium sp. 179]MCK1541432.1 hypothetical protein [Bradyrhizobium sp. 179]
MSPEERAKTACEEFLVVIAMHIREAEDAALERAALIAWNAGQTGVAGLIREKKHAQT